MVVGESLVGGANVPFPVEDQNTAELVYVIILHQRMEVLIVPVMLQKPNHAMKILAQVCKRPINTFYVTTSLIGMFIRILFDFESLFAIINYSTNTLHKSLTYLLNKPFIS